MTVPTLGWLLGAENPANAITLLLAALLAGLVRGFTGFGFAMIFVPLASLAVPPPVAVGLIWTLDTPYALPLALRSVPQADWREVIPLATGAALLLPLGVWLLTRLDPVPTRWIVAVLVLGALAALASGWRYRARPSRSLSLAVGGASGLAGGLAGLTGLPLAVFWLGSQRNDAAQIRHNLMAYFGVSALIMGAVFAWQGVLTTAVLVQGAVLLIPYGVGIALGTRGFRATSEPAFRAIAYAVIAAGAVLAMPVFDAWLR